MPPSHSTDGLQHGLYLQNTPANIGDLATPRNLLAYATTAEAAGWDGVFMADALGGEGPSYVDPWITLAGVATRTDTIRLGTWITPVPRRQPWQLAADLAVLDALSDGRTILGAGLGAPWNYEATGIGYDPVRLGDRYDEALEIITALWDGGEVSHDGDHFQLDGLELPTTPVQEPRIPTVMGVWWPNKKPLRRAARYDGIMPVGPSFYGGEGVQGEQPTGTFEEELHDMLAYYRETAGGDGSVFLPIDVPEASDDVLDLCSEHDIDWALSTSLLDDAGHEANLDRIRDGPPS